MFKVNGEPVAKITEDGRLYCKNITMGGVSIVDLINSINDNIEIIGDDFVTHTELQNGTYELNVSSIITNTATVNTINGCVIAASTETLPCIPYIKTDKVIELGDTVDLHYNASDDYTVRLNATQNGCLRISNSKNAIDAFDLFSTSNDRVEFHLGKSNNTDDCAVFQYNVVPKTLGFGFFDKNNLLVLDTNGAINGAVIAPTDSSVTPTSSFIPVVKSGDSAMSIGKRLDFHDVLGDSLDYRVRLEAMSDGALRLYNYNASNHPLQIISNNSQSVQVQFGRNPSENYMGIIQFNYASNNGSTIGLGTWGHNNVVTIDQSGTITANGGVSATGNISTSGTLTASSDASIGGDLQVNGDISTLNDVAITGDETVGGDLSVSGAFGAGSLTNPMKTVLLQLMYPVGSVYMSATSHDNPNTIFGVVIGTWIEITTDRFLLSSDSTKTLGEQGGSLTHNHTTANHKLTKNEMPFHNHAIFCAETNYLQGNHQKVLSSDTYGGFGEWLYTTNYVVGEDKPQPFIGAEGGSQPHNHGNTGDASVMPPYYRVHAWYRSA
jgi:hypothetical protein